MTTATRNYKLHYRTFVNEHQVSANETRSRPMMRMRNYKLYYCTFVNENLPPLCEWNSSVPDHRAHPPFFCKWVEARPAVDEIVHKCSGIMKQIIMPSWMRRAAGVRMRNLEIDV
jgi:hypothetical protein